MVAALMLLTGCGTIRDQAESAVSGGVSGLTVTLVSCLFIAVVLLLLTVIVILQDRYQILRLFRPASFLSRVPILGDYVTQALGVQRGVRQIDAYKKTAEQYARGGQPTTSGYRRAPKGYTTPPNQRGNQTTSTSGLTNRIRRLFGRQEIKSAQAEADEHASALYQRLKGQDDQPAGDPASAAAGAAAAATLAADSQSDTVSVPISESESATPRPASTGTPPPLIIPRFQIGRAPVPPEFTFDIEAASYETEIDIIARRLDRYQVDAFLGEGTQSHQYIAHDLKLDRPVFIKVIRPEFAQDSELQEQLLQEVRITAALNHPNIVEIYDYDMVENHLFIVYELVNGVPVNGYMRHMREHRGHVKLSQMLNLTSNVADALFYAHQKGIVHGHVRPEHVLLASALPDQVLSFDDDGIPLQVKITDFGLGQLTSDLSEVEQAMLPYLSPEQCKGDKIDGRADIYAIGVMLYNLVTGRLPFEVDNIADAIHQHTSVQPIPPTQFRPALPLAVEKLILRAMHKDPDKRFLSADEFATALSEVAETLADTIEAATVLDLEGQVIAITSEGEPPRKINLQGRYLFIGAEPNNDIVLPAKGVSPYHARLEPSPMGWRVVDMGSRTGTFFGDARLLTDLGEEWSERQVLHIGPYALRRENFAPSGLTAGSVSGEPGPLTRAGAAGVAGAAAATQDGVAGEGDGEAAGYESLTGILPPIVTVATIGVRLLPQSLAVEAGDRGDIQISLTNQGTHVDHFQVTIDGLPGEWIWLSDNDIQLMPGASGFLLMTIQPPRTSAAVAGTHTFQIRVQPLSTSEVWATANGTLTIHPFELLQVEMHPQRIRNKGLSTLSLHNQSNQPLNVSLKAKDPGDEIDFGERNTATELAMTAGEKLELDLPVRAKSRPWVGARQYLPFEVNFDTADQTALPQSGQLEVGPRIPSWLIAIFGLFVPLLCIILAFGINYVDNQWAMATATAEAEQTRLAAAVVTSTPSPTLEPTVAPLPISCSDIRAQNETAISADSGEPAEIVDGEYTLYAFRDINQPYTVYCHDMAGVPQEYISLTLSDNDHNFAQLNYPADEMVTIYQRIHIDPRTLTIDVTDRTFATTIGDFPQERFNIDRDIDGIDYGAAIGCSERETTIIGRANIDLQGTNFALAETVGFVSNGVDIVGEQITFGPNRQTVDLTIGGRCGWIISDGEIRLQYVMTVPISEP